MLAMTMKGTMKSDRSPRLCPNDAVMLNLRIDDAVNQSAARLARELGEERTIGIFRIPNPCFKYLMSVT
jgi:hypothetical protein